MKWNTKVICSICGKEHCADDCMEKDGKIICYHCAADEGWYQCDHCEEWFNIEDKEMIFVENYGIACEHCIETSEDFLECEECGKTIWVYSDTEPLCCECFTKKKLHKNN